MRAAAIGAAVGALAILGAAFPVLPLVSSPESPRYLAYLPGLISSARERVWAALSDLRLYGDGATDPLVEALAEAAARGVDVRVLLERREGLPRAEQLAARKRLEDGGAEVRWDTPEVTLHAKFLLVDGRLVVGSSHWTKSALTGSVQVDLVLDSRELAGQAAEFFELAWQGKLGARLGLPEDWPAGAVLPVFDLPGSELHLGVIGRLLAGAEREVDLLLYGLSYYPQYRDSPANTPFEGLEAALARGVRVRVLLESGEAFPYLREGNALSASLLSLHGAAVRLDRPGVTMHAKCLIVDERAVLVSSANWNYYSLEKNVEAGVAFLDAPALASYLKAEFDSLWESGWWP
jgi:phosphatidylserine/phosphatidylglycerophosphate/cardiolipin synthase-like enzyme